MWDMAWQVAVATLCRLSLTTIDTAFLGHLGTEVGSPHGTVSG